MAIDVHAHYVPREVLEQLHREGRDLGIHVVQRGVGCPCVHFDYGLQVRPFFERLLEPESSRIAAMDANGIARQVLTLWADIFGYGLPGTAAARWHRLMNDALADTCERHPERFSWFGSGPLPDAAAAARELERCVRERGARGGIVAANVEGRNLGELDLDEYWASAEALGVPVFIHPAQAMALPRTGRFGLNTIVQYTFDTTLTLGSLIFSGVLDRFPRLELIVSHGGGALPYLIGRFDVMSSRMNRDAERCTNREAPSAYLRRFHYDTILHDAEALRFLAERVQTDRLVLGSDDPFPPMDKDPLRSLRQAGFGPEDVRRISEDNARGLLKL